MKKVLPTTLFCLLGLLVCLLLGALLHLFTPRLPQLPEEIRITTTKKKIPKTSTKAAAQTKDFYLRVKNKGDCKALTGKILLFFILVSDGDFTYTPEANQEFQKNCEKTIERLKNDAAAHVVTLEVQCHFISCSMPEAIPRDDMQFFIPSIAQKAGFADCSQIAPTLNEAYGTDSTATFFCFNRSERSFCIPSAKENAFEYAVLYGSTEDFRHELYHLYGARDLYTPDIVNTVAQKYYFDSIMRLGENGTYLDSLSAYLIGWSDTLDEKATAFLKDLEQ